MTDEHPDPERLWRWRRRMALWAFFAAVGQTAYLVASETTVADTVVAWSYGLWGLVIVAYIANCAVEKMADNWSSR